jgi:hypothetical protein
MNTRMIDLNGLERAHEDGFEESLEVIDNKLTNGFEKASTTLDPKKLGI